MSRIDINTDPTPGSMTNTTRVHGSEGHPICRRRPAMSRVQDVLPRRERMFATCALSFLSLSAIGASVGVADGPECDERVELSCNEAEPTAQA